MRDRPGLELEAWIGSEERAEGQRLRHPGRRRQWLLGRAAAKLLALELMPWLSPLGLRVRRGPLGAPELRDAGGRSLPFALSLSHSADLALAAIRPGRPGGLGVDLERIEPRHPAFLEDFFTDREQAWFGRLADRPRWLAVSLAWAVKEAVLKARGVGLAEDARRVELRPCSLEPAGASPLEVQDPDGARPTVGWGLGPDHGFVMVWACASST
jgi:4'-phosphopantetheinyl transferase